MQDTTPIERIVEAIGPRFTRLSDEIWDDPHLRWQEYGSMEKQIAAAEEFGFTVQREAGGIPTAFSAEKGEGGPVIAFLGEYDSLAGLSQASGVAEPAPNPETSNTNGQGCGHNLLGSGSLLAAVAAAKHLEEEGLPGRVRYYGCPAEEAAAGKTFMVQGGAFDGVDAAVSWHPAPVMTATQILTLSYAQVYFRYTGVASHAGADPAHGRSALDAVELCNVGVNFLREHMSDTARVHYAITDAGGHSPNVVQANASVYYVVRANTVAEMRELYDRVVKIAQGAALMTETTLEIDFDGACAEILPNVALEQALQANVESIGGVPFDDADREAAAAFTATVPEREVAGMRRFLGLPAGAVLQDGVLPLGDPNRRQQMTGSSDVGDVSWTVPTVQITGATCAVGTPGHSWQMVAQGKLPAAHKGMLHAAKAMAATAVDLMVDADLLAAARAEFEGIIAETPYDCPIPEGVVAPPLRAGNEAHLIASDHAAQVAAQVAAG
ncbi:amidohydrolase [Agromyces sp. LHK192]|uniref:amidohydrolase n=1 Tax=Agromyces sp. LHK192 TaxID=2498704 RepID=UPI000FD93942|nr:amidohydrolase [Agromyces sp. LHK192]